MSFSDQQGEEEGANNVCRENDGPKAQNFSERGEIFVQEKRKDRSQRVFGEELLATENDDQKPERVTRAGDERTPRRVGKERGESGFCDEREAHREASGESRPRESDGGTLEFFFTFEADGFVDDLCADGDAFLNFLCFGDGGDRAFRIFDDRFYFLGWRWRHTKARGGLR